MREAFDFNKKKNSSEFKYPDEYLALKVKHQGNIKLFKADVYLCQFLAGEYIGVKQLSFQNYEIYFRDILYATYDRFTSRIVKVCTSQNLAQ